MKIKIEYFIVIKKIKVKKKSKALLKGVFNKEIKISEIILMIKE